MRQPIRYLKDRQPLFFSLFGLVFLLLLIVAVRGVDSYLMNCDLYLNENIERSTLRRVENSVFNLESKVKQKSSKRFRHVKKFLLKILQGQIHRIRNSFQWIFVRLPDVITSSICIFRTLFKPQHFGGREPCYQSRRYYHCQKRGAQSCKIHTDKCRQGKFHRYERNKIGVGVKRERMSNRLH